MKSFDARFLKIISGGQTGVDRAALDFALSHQMRCGGYCPKYRRAEDGTIPMIYPLTEMQTKSYPARTRQNILTSDGTLLLFLETLDKGSILTKKLCIQLLKPIWLQSMLEETMGINFLQWLLDNHIQILNIAGPRESFAPGIYQRTLRFLETVF